MSLQEYKRKRNFRKTTEPVGGISKKKQPIFVVQEHWASHLHYDFRLEAFGTLKSWAVPKGPSTQVGDKRLAVEVEDHPIGYATFKGRIPEGEYGAGIVKIWDHGFWIPPENLKESLTKGHLEFELKGKKLKGKWLLQRTNTNSGKKHQWLLIKRHDKPKEKNIIQDLLKNKKKDPMPAFVSPQLALLSKTVPKSSDWIHEIKFDGYRTLSTIKNKKITMRTRSGLDWTEKYQPLDKEIKKIKVQSAILDGEIVAINKNGQSDFSQLQDAISNDDMSNVFYYVFDLLYLNGQDLREKPLELRKQLLKKLVTSARSKKIIFSEHWRNQGEELFKKACHEGLEGIISKDRTLGYSSGRSEAWQKIKCSLRQEFVIGGYTDPEGDRTGLGSLLMGTYEKSKLRYVGRVGTGFNTQTLSDLIRKLEKLEIKSPAFDQDVPKKSGRIHWVKPTLVAEVEFKAWTHDGILRHASFQGLREDKKAKDVHLEKPKQDMKKQKVKPKSAAKVSKKDFIITHPKRLIYPKQKITKLDVAEYYKSVSPWLLPHVENRPLSVLRCPDQAAQHCFFQKHIDNSKLTEIHEHLVKDQKVIYLDNEKGLLQLVQWGVLEIHTWQSHIKNALYADQLVFDLDPEGTVTWKQIVQTAFRLKDMLEQLSLTSFVKTTGGKGIHIHVPVAPIYSWDKIKAFSKTVVQQLTNDFPELYTVNPLKKTRHKKIFLDYLRNGFGATAVAPYALRSKDKPTVAVPITWDELKKIKNAQVFDIHSTLKHLAQQKKDPWPKYFSLKQKIKILKPS